MNNLNVDIYKDFALVFPPRTGGTTELLNLALRNGKFVYINNRHTSLQHTAKILNEVFGVDCVYVSGKYRLEKSSPKVNTDKEITFDPWFGHIYEKHFNVSGYHYLINLTYEGDLPILTVPYVAVRDIEPSGTLLIDEEATIEFFKPKSQLLYSIDWSDSIKQNNEEGHKIVLEQTAKRILAKVPKKLKKEYPEFVKWLENLCQRLEEAYLGWDRRRCKLKEHILKLLSTLPQPPYCNLSEEEKEELILNLLKHGWRIEHYEVIEFFISSLYFVGYHLHSTRTRHEIRSISLPTSPS